MSEIYAIVFKGDIVEGHDPDTVKAQVSKLLKADEKKTAALFSGKQIVLKKTADKQEAAKYGKVLKKVGADVKIRIVKGDAPKPEAKPAFQAADPPVFQKADPPAFQKADAPAAEPAQEPTPTPEPVAASEPEPVAEEAPVVDTSGISLAPQEGNIVEAAPEAEAPDLDLSGMEVAEMDETFLAEPTEEIEVELDLSEYSVSENDGSPLVEASDDVVPEVEVPDFGLDEPGAILETIQEEKEELNPNTVGMTLAMAGSDLLEEEERDQEPPPPAPDTSKINLVPNFDV